MNFHSELAKGLFLLEKISFEDDRGLFQRVFCPEELLNYWEGREIFQVNRSITKNVGTFRGFHFQKPPFCEMKFVQCVRGAVLDIVIDLRTNSETFLEVFKFELSAKNNMALVIPEGFAHGFQVLEPDSELLYFHSAPYKKEFEDGINYKDPLLKIELPLPVAEVSARDQSFNFIDKDYKGIQL